MFVKYSYVDQDMSGKSPCCRCCLAIKKQLIFLIELFIDLTPLPAMTLSEVEVFRKLLSALEKYSKVHIC